MTRARQRGNEPPPPKAATAGIDAGDYTHLARHYRHRVGYSRTVLRVLLDHAAAGRPSREIAVADVGAGTGKLAEDLYAVGLRRIVCVEPNAAMRGEGMAATIELGIQWREGLAEMTGLPEVSVDWVLMGSSFHWADAPKALAEFHRVLRPGGLFTAVWNPRHIEPGSLHERIERRIRKIVPGLRRVSSGAAPFTEKIPETLVSTGRFEDVFLTEAREVVRMPPERYLGIWRSVNDVQAQAGPKRWPLVLAAIREEIAGLSEIVVPYRTRAFTARRTDRAPSS